VAISKNKVCLKGINISGYQRHPKEMWWWYWKLLHKFQKCFQQWQHRWAKCIAAQVEYFEGEPSQSALSIQVCLQLNLLQEPHSHTQCACV
jgi:hypothetical protein